MHISPAVFDREFSRFKALIKEHSDGREFTTFHQGLPAEWEAYKENVRHEALNRLQMSTWKSADIGSGEILKRSWEIRGQATNLDKSLLTQALAIHCEPIGGSGSELTIDTGLKH